MPQAVPWQDAEENSISRGRNFSKIPGNFLSKKILAQWRAVFSNR